MKCVFSSDSDVSTDDQENTAEYTDITVDFIPANHNINKLLPPSSTPVSAIQQVNADTLLTTASDIWAEPAHIPDSPTLTTTTDNNALRSYTTETHAECQDDAWAMAAEIPPDTPPTILGYRNQHSTHTTPIYINTSIPISPISILNDTLYTSCQLNDTLHTSCQLNDTPHTYVHMNDHTL